MDEQGFYEIETPMLTQVDARGRARLPRAVAGPSRRFLRAAAVAADLQADPHDRGHGQVLPDRALLPRRGPARRPPARVHPGRHRDVVPAHRDDLRADRAAVRAPAAPWPAITVERPFPRMPYSEAIARYGSDKPDLRFGMPITDVTDEIATLGLDTFPALIADGARARAIVLPASAGVSGTRLRKINEEVWLGRIVGDARATKRNLFTLKATDEAVANLVKKGASEAVARRIFEKAGARQGRHRAHGGRRRRAAVHGHGHPAPGDGPRAEARGREGLPLPVGHRLPAHGVRRRGEALREPAPSLHRPARRGPGPARPGRRARCGPRPTTSC